MIKTDRRKEPHSHPGSRLYLAKTVAIFPGRRGTVRVLIDCLPPTELQYDRTYSARQYIESAFRSRFVRADDKTQVFIKRKKVRDLDKPLVF